ncbi:acyl-CoA dehydrogenase [Paraburkholderia fungorum]|uniref:acyl-CoA dehydrogenase n=1 Tax=Paraburkholderia fungorum TaxID=134537 RepID=UPI00402B4911
MHRILYQAPQREMSFLLWEQLRLQDATHLHDRQARESVEQTLAQVRAFAEGPMTASYAEADEQEAHLDASGTVRTPASFGALLERYREIWSAWQPPSDATPGIEAEVVQNLIIEMLVGSNPSFVTYVGFNGPAQTLLNAYGSDELKTRYGPALRSLEASACLCITEKAAGSDLTQIACVARKQESGTYLMSGHKWLISAGMHELTRNIYYFVLARTGDEQSGMLGLSCFLVPRYRLDAAGQSTIDNGVRCREVVRKMGLRGCANTHLEFSQAHPTHAFLLGEMEGRGLQQLMLMMTPARISTGIYALGLAASACDSARRYADARIQGKQFDQSMSNRAPSLPISAHPDVRRMRLDMLSVTNGARALIAKLGVCQAHLRLAEPASEHARVADDLLDILLPIVKAYTSDQAWRVTEQAIQTFGGAGYLRDYPVEQNARDCKILSIWEGTNHIQSLFLVRDKLGLCLRTQKLDTLTSEIVRVLASLTEAGGFVAEIGQMERALAALKKAAEAIGACVRRRGMNQVPAYSCEFQTGLAEIAIAWQLLEAACVAHDACVTGPADETDRRFYEEKLEAARYFLNRRLPQAATVLLNIVDELSSVRPAASAARAQAETADAN